MSAVDAISLTRSLLAYDTINPPGREQDCARHAGALLGEWGFSVAYHEYEPGRTSVVARAGASDAKAPLCLTGHLDTVALGTRAWSKDPFAGEADGESHLRDLVNDFTPDIQSVLLRWVDANADQLPDSHFVVRKNKAAARAEINETASQLRHSAFPTHFQINFHPVISSSLSHNAIP